MNQDHEDIEEQETIIDEGYEKDLEGLGVAQKQVRKYNRQLIVTYLRKRSPVLRADMAKNLNLSRATVTTIVKQLKKEKLVIEEQQPYLVGSKPTRRILFNVDFGYVIGIDVGRSRLRIYLTNLSAKIIDQLSESFDTRVSVEEGLERITRNVRELVIRNAVGWTSVRGIGMGIAGSVNRDGTKVISPPMWRHWSDTNIPAALRMLLGLEPEFPILLDNDANLGALGENRYGQGRGVKNAIYAKLSTGIGIGLILKGEPYRGENGVAGEFGHIRAQFGKALAENSPVCASCGQKGCLEALSGLSAIVQTVHANPSSKLYRPVAESNIVPEHMAEMIIEAGRGDCASRAALEEAGERIGEAIGSYLINVYNPALILLDGGIVRPSKGGQVYENTLLLEKLKQKARESSLAVAWAGTNISLGQLGDDAVGLGAVATVIDKDPELNISQAI